MDDNIAKVVSRCLATFKLLTLKEQGWSDSEVQFSSVQDELSRFRVWAGNIGAHRSGRSSLEYRLRDASHIRAQVLRLLGDLSELLQDADSILRGEKVPWDRLPDDDSNGAPGEEYSSEEDDPDSSVPATELAQILRNLTDITNCLLRLSVAIRNPAPHDRFRKSKSTDTSHFEPFDIQHVRTKFPQMDQDISERLGKAISRRRQYFKYREAHHANLSQGLDLDTNKTEIIPKSTIASSIPDKLKGDSTFNVMALDEDAASDTGASQTSYATSVAASNELRVPPLPAGARDGPFECPFCYMMIVASSRMSWKKHVFRDLHPYICLHNDCEAPDQDFGRRQRWMDHILQYHWKTWQCPCGCSTKFASSSSCKEHLTKAHPEAFSPSQVNTIVKLSERPMNFEEGIECPICGQPLKSAKQYQRHVGAHQEQLSLFALPNLSNDEDMDGDPNESDIDEAKDESDIYSDELEEPHETPAVGLENLDYGPSNMDKTAAQDEDAPIHSRGSVPSASEQQQGSIVSPPQERGEERPLEGVITTPTFRFPEEPNSIREGVHSHGAGVQWTKVSRRLVSPEALTIGKERFEVRDEFVIVLRILSREELADYTEATTQLREMGSLEVERDRLRPSNSPQQSQSRSEDASLDTDRMTRMVERIEHGDGGYEYTSPADLARYDLDHPRESRPRLPHGSRPRIKIESRPRHLREFRPRRGSEGDEI